MARRISKEEAAAVVMEDIAAGRYKKWPEQCPHCQEPLPADMMGYKVAHARGAAEERAAVVAWLRQPDNDFGQAAPAIEAGEHRSEGAGPDWQCGHCGDHQQGHPETCWACGQVFHAKEGG